MFKIVAVIKKKGALSRDEFLHEWNVEHPRYVAVLPGLIKYQQNVAIKHRKEWPYDGMAELWFESLKDIATAYSGPEGEALFSHENNFLEDVQWFISEENEINLSGARMTN